MLAVVKVMKGWKSPLVNGLILVNFAASIGFQVWMLLDLDRIRKEIPEAELNAKRTTQQKS